MSLAHSCRFRKIRIRGGRAADTCSRELVAKVLLACAATPQTEGLSFDVMDGKESVEQALRSVVEKRVDAWTG